MNQFAWSFGSPPDPPSLADSGGLRRLGVALGAQFEVLGLLGAGAMGAVYRVRERETGRLLAVKVLRDVDPGAKARLLSREGALTAQLKHSGIITVHSGGELGDGAYLVYDLVEGCQPLQANPGEAGRRLFLERLHAVGLAVGHAHAQGIVHRDLKPENLLVDVEGRVRVADFGLAWAQDVERLTQTRALLGTPLYMAPEMFLGASPAPTADVWALGVILYEGLTGELPFSAPSLVELMAQVSSGSFAPADSMDPTISSGLASVCRRALVRDPAKRLSDGQAFASALRQAMNAESGSRALRAVQVSALVLLSSAVLAAVALQVQPRLAPEPAAQPAPELGPDPSTAPSHPEPGRSYEAREAREARDRLVELRALRDPRVRARELADWLTDFPEHPLAAEARELLRLARRQLPLFETRHPLRVRGREHLFPSWMRDGFISVSWGGAPSVCRFDDRGTLVSTTDVPLEFLVALGDRGPFAWQQAGALHVDADLTRLGAQEALLLPAGAKMVRTVCQLPSGSLLVGFDRGDVFELDLRARSWTRRVRSLASPIWLEVTPDRQAVAMSMWGRREAMSFVVVYDLETWRERSRSSLVYGTARFAFLDPTTLALAGRLDGALVTLGPSGFGELRRFEAGLKVKEAAQFGGFGTPPPAIHSAPIKTVSAWRGRVFTTSAAEKRGRGILRVWDAASCTLEWETDLPDEPRAAAIDARGLLIAFRGGTIRCYPVE